MANIKPVPKSHITKMENSLVRLLWGSAAKAGYKTFEMAQIMETTPATVRRRKLAPKDFTLEEIFRLCAALNIPFSDVAEAMGGGKSAI